MDLPLTLSIAAVALMAAVALVTATRLRAARSELRRLEAVRREGESALAESEERFRRSFEDSREGMALIGVEGGQIGRLLRVNEALISITGYPRARLTGIAPLTLLHPDEHAALAEDLRALLDGQLPAARREARLLDAEGEVVWVALTVSVVRDRSGEPSHAVLQVQDVSERKRFEGQARYLADHDALTGVFNLRRFESELAREVAAAQRHGSGGAVLVLDLDQFKYVNDSLGHSAGDELIAIIAEILRRCLRESDILARMGGDGFAVILPHADKHRARRVAESLLGEIRGDERAASASGMRRVTASIGVAAFAADRDELSAQNLLAEADIALSDAKEAGRDRVEVFDRRIARTERMRTRSAWSEVEAAMESGRFVLHAQPIVSLEGPRSGRHELLLRMVGEEGDLMLPGTFLHVAEHANLVQRIDRWVLEQAVDLLAEQQRLGRDVIFEVNLSGKSINPPMAEFIASTVDAAGVNPAKLSFEVTETAAIVNLAQAQTFAEQLHEIGSTFALDDFGAGFASFYYLKHLAFDYLKIDGEFVQDLGGSRTNQLVVRSVVNIARGLGKRTIAEFVGDLPTVELLREYGVDYAQGFFIGRPIPISQVDFARPLAELVAPPLHRSSTGPGPLIAPLPDPDRTRAPSSSSG